jgi:hypothetical protein
MPNFNPEVIFISFHLHFPFTMHPFSSYTTQIFQNVTNSREQDSKILRTNYIELNGDVGLYDKATNYLISSLLVLHSEKLCIDAPDTIEA